MFSIWDIDNSAFNNPIKKTIGELYGKSTRENTRRSDAGGINHKYKSTTSYFNPYLCKLVYDAYCPPDGWIFDPFASITRPYMAHLCNFNYIGCEIRFNEVEKIRKLITPSSFFSLPNQSNVVIENIDCRAFDSTKKFDLVFTCPPYWNLEVYSDMPSDLSNYSNYDDFLCEITKVYAKCFNLTHANSFMCIVVGDFRDYSNNRMNVNRLIPYTSDTIKCAENSSWILYDRIILKKPMGSAPARVRTWNTRKVVRIHEELLVFRKTMQHPDKWWELTDDIEKYLEL